MPVISAPEAFNEEALYVDLESIFGQSLFLKCEGFNFAGSIKLKAATEMVDAAERDGVLTPESVLVESSSGNLGVALSMIAASRGYRFLCVTDFRCNLSTRRLMEALGSQVDIIAADPEAKGGLLGARRMIPGLGTSVRPPLLDESYVDEVVLVEEAAAIRACHRLARRGFLFGGSTGTVVSGAMDWLAQHDARELTTVAIAPDLGERYLDTIYQANWLRDLYDEDVLSSDELTDRRGHRGRAVPGHWPGDLVVGKHGGAAVVTLVDPAQVNLERREERLGCGGPVAAGRLLRRGRDVIRTLTSPG